MHPFTQRGIRYCAAGHAVMAALCFLVTIRVVGFGFLATRSGIFLMASLVALTLTSLYLAVAIGIFERKQWARAGGILLSEAGIGVGMFVLLEALLPIVPSIQITGSFWVAFAGALILYLGFSALDLAMIFFLASPRTTAAFAGKEYAAPWPDMLSPLELLLARIFRISP